jgi:hypothetical protein
MSSKAIAVESGGPSDGSSSSKKPPLRTHTAYFSGGSGARRTIVRNSISARRIVSPTRKYPLQVVTAYGMSVAPTPCAVQLNEASHGRCASRR